MERRLPKADELLLRILPSRFTFAKLLAFLFFTLSGALTRFEAAGCLSFFRTLGCCWTLLRPPGLESDPARPPSEVVYPPRSYAISPCFFRHVSCVCVPIVLPMLLRLVFLWIIC